MRGASAGSAVAPQQNPGTDAATLSRGSPVSGGEHRLAPTLGDLLQAPEAGRQRRLAVLRRDPRNEPEAQPHDGVRIGAQRRDLAKRVPHLQAVRGRKGEERRRHAGDGGIEPVQPAALDQQRVAAREIRRREPRHQLREGTRVPGAEGHVERAVEAGADADSCTDTLGLAYQQLRRQRGRERTGLGRLGETGRCVVRGRDGAPVGRRRAGPVHHAAHCAERLVFAEPLAHDPGLRERGGDGIEQRLVPGPEALQGEPGALRGAGAGEPVPQPLPERLPLALEPVARQRGRPRPAGQHQGLGGDQRAEPRRPFGQQVVEVEPEPAGLTAHGLPMRGRKRVRFVGRALERDVERVAGRGEGRVEPARGKLDEAFELFRAHHRAGAVEGEQRDQGAVMADQRPAAAVQRHRGLGCQKTLERFAPQRPAQALEVVHGGGERDRHDLRAS